MRAVSPIVFILAVAILEVRALEDFQKEFNETYYECTAEFGVHVRIGDSLNGVNKCFHKCITQKLGIMSATGEVQIPEFKSKYLPGPLLEAAVGCLGNKGANPCLTSEMIYLCINSKRT